MGHELAHPGQADPLTVDQIRDLTIDWLPTDELRRQVLVENPGILYGFDPASLKEPAMPEMTRPARRRELRDLPVVRATAPCS